MWNALLNFLVGCSHSTTSFPLTTRRKLDNHASRIETYVVCLECGKEFEYDWVQMCIKKPVRVPTPASIQEQPLRT